MNMPLYRATKDGREELTPEEEAAFEAEALEYKRQHKRVELDAMYQSTISADIDYSGKTYTATADRRALLGEVLSIGSVPENMFWLDASGTQVSMTHTDLQGLGRAMLDRGVTASINLNFKLAAVDAASTIEEIEAVTW